MRTSRRAVVLGFLVAVCAPGAVSASPIIGATAGSSCGALSAATSCGRFDLDPFTPRIVDGQFESAGDVALFEFEFDVETILTVTTTSYAAGNFDPTLGLFERGGDILSVPDPANGGALGFARFFDVDLFGGLYDDHIDVTLGPGSYIMALAAGELGESLLSPFFCETGGCDFNGGNAFSFSVSATPVDGNTEPVPEPATVTLVAGGALAGWLQRRRARSRRQSAPVSS
jgi:hypothetical protein